MNITTYSKQLILGIAAIFVILGCSEESQKSTLKFDNASFYSSDGTFDIEAGKDAYIEVMKYHGYPVFDGIRDKMWVSDYGLGEFTTLGLGAIGFINNYEDNYMGQDLYLLPGQMLPEHYHIDTDKAQSKMEGWHVRHGISYVYGEGERTQNMKAIIPESQKEWVSVWHETILHVGESATLNRATARNWQFGGPKGAIVSEYATYHDNDGVRHSNPNIVFP